MLIKKKYFSQYQQDKYLDRAVFNKMRNGIFVDVGAYDGITYSNTYFFEKYRGWTGICFEPNPAVFPQLKKNRKSININSCAGANNGMVDFFQISGYPEMLSGIAESYDGNHLKRISTEIDVHGGEKKIIKVQCINLNDYLLDNTHLMIDYLSLDTEGNEMEILESLDLHQIKIKAITVENNSSQNLYRKYLSQYGFGLEKVFKCDELYVRSK